MLTLEAVKRYCKIDSDEEDGLVLELIDSAKDYLSGAGVEEPTTGYALYDLAVKAHVLHFYDHRGEAESGSLNEIPGFSNVVNQLKLRAEAARAAEVS